MCGFESHRRYHFMKTLLLLLLACGASAQPRCPGGEKPSLTVHPFRSLVCSSSPDVALSTRAVKLSLPRTAETAEQALERVAGAWEGWAAFGMQRYEVLLTLAREGKGWRGKLLTRDHKTLRLWPLEGLLSASGSGASLNAWLGLWPKLQAKATLAFGSQDKEAKRNDAVLLSDKAGASQLLLFSKKGSKLDVVFRDLRRPSMPPVEISLSPSKRTSL